MSQVDQVRAAADIVKIVGDYVKLRKAGVNLMGLCPFHQEKTPSFAVHPVKQIFHCFGCGVGGDVFKFVMQIENISFPEALERVAEKVGIELHGSVDREAYDASAKERARLYKIHEMAVQLFSAQLASTAEGRAARAYLADRGVSDEAVGFFRLGYAPAEGGALTRALAAAGFSAETLEKSGLILRDSEGKRSFDRFRRRIIFPIANESGKVVAFGGRALGDDQPKYLNSPETPIYTKGRMLYHLDRAAASIRKLNYAVLVEGYMDCIAVASSGVENVVASCGTSLTESQVRILARHSRRVVVNYDPDSAGVAATERSLALLLEAGFEVKVLALPGGLDPDSFVRQRGPNAYREALARAPTYLDYLTERAVARHDLSRPEGKVAAANALMPYIARVPDPLLRAGLSSRLAARLGVDDRLLRQELERAAAGRRQEVSLSAEAQASQFNHGVKLLLRACLEDEDLSRKILRDLIESGDCAGIVGERVFRRLLEAHERGEEVQPASLADSLDPNERRLVYDSLFWEGRTPEDGWAAWAWSFRLALRRERIKRERQRLKGEMEDAARRQDFQKMAEVEKANSKLTKELAELGKT